MTPSLNAELESLATRLLSASRDAGRALDPDAFTFLLRHYAATGREDVRDALADALASSFARAAAATSVTDRAAWLVLFAELSLISDDDRLPPIVGELTSALRREWPAATEVRAAMISVDACLRAADLVDARTMVPAAIDELERIVGGAYEPGKGMAGVIHARDTRDRGPQGAFEDQIQSAATLLTAFETSGRLPYSMLAEELTQIAVRNFTGAVAFDARCDAVSVLCRLSALHDDEAYCSAAVVAPDADYKAEAERVLTVLRSDAALASEENVAAYALALLALRNAD